MTWKIKKLLRELGIFEIVIKDDYPKIISLFITIFANKYRTVKLFENLKHIPIKYYKTRELVAEEVVHFE